MGGFPAIDTDGHIIERDSDIRKYLESPWNRRSTPLRPGDQPWDSNLFDTFEMAVAWRNYSPSQQIDQWHKIMDQHRVEAAVCFPTSSRWCGQAARAAISNSRGSRV